MFDAVASRAAIPMVSIVEAAAAHVAALGLTRAALLGTRYTMDGQFYPEVFARRGLGLVVPPEPDRSLVHDRYINELLKNVFTLVDPDEVGREFAVHGYEMVATDAVDVPDQKQMLALVFGRRRGV